MVKFTSTPSPSLKNPESMQKLFILKVYLSHTSTSRPWRPERRTGYTNTHEANSGTPNMRTRGIGEGEKERVNLQEDEDPDPKDLE